jgi:Flp pilus assembly protein TadG
VVLRRTQLCRRRRAALTLEAAFVYPIMLVLLLGLMVGGMGVFYSELVACQAREATRYACVRGTNYQKYTGNKPPTQQQILQNVVCPLAAGMDLSSLTIQVYWINGVTGQAVSWDTATQTPTTATASGALVNNTVQVTVTYQWSSPLFLSGPINVQSTSQLPMSY